MRIRIRVGDEVQVMRGSRNRNPEKPPTRGKVLEIDRERGLVWVEGYNQRIRHLKKTPRHPQGGRVRREAPVAMSKVMLVTSDGRPARLSKIERGQDGAVVLREGAGQAAGETPAAKPKKAAKKKASRKASEE